MLKSNLKKLIVCLVFAIILAFTVRTVFATEGNDDLVNQLTNLKGNESIQEGAKQESLEVEEEEEEEEEEEPETIEEAPKKENTNKPETTPYTGIEDNSSIIFIAIFAASAVYAYIKVKKYDF